MTNDKTFKLGACLGYIIMFKALEIMINKKQLTIRIALSSSTQLCLIYYCFHLMPKDWSKSFLYTIYVILFNYFNYYTYLFIIFHYDIKTEVD